MGSTKRIMDLDIDTIYDLDYRMIDFNPFHQGQNKAHDNDSKTLNYVLKMNSCRDRTRHDAFVGRIRVWLNERVGECGADIIMVVPGHSPGGASSVWDEILQGVTGAKRAKREVLERVTEVPKSTSPQGVRNKAVHIWSIVVKDKELVTGKTVLIVDDVYTSGATMSACFELVKKAGAAAVFTAAVGKTC